MNKYRNLAQQVGGVSELGQRNMVTTPAELRPQKGCAGEALQEL
jgi:hypothetical protein